MLLSGKYFSYSKLIKVRSEINRHAMTIYLSKFDSLKGNLEIIYFGKYIKFSKFDQV